MGLWLAWVVDGGDHHEEAADAAGGLPEDQEGPPPPQRAPRAHAVADRAHDWLHELHGGADGRGGPELRCATTDLMVEMHR